MSREDIPKRAAELADKGVRTVEDMAARAKIPASEITKHRGK